MRQLYHLLLHSLHGKLALPAPINRLLLLLRHNLNLGLRVHIFLIILLKPILNLFELALSRFELCLCLVRVSLRFFHVADKVVLPLHKLQLLLLFLVNRLLLQCRVLLLKRGHFLIE